MAKGNPACTGCPLESSPSKFIPAIGATNAQVAIVGEAGGANEGRQAIPFCGPAGSILDQGLRMVFMEREEVRIFNTIQCSPPGDWLVNAPYEHQAINHCRVHRDPLLEEPHRVFLAVGATSSRVLLQQPKKGFVLDEWHSTVSPFGEGRWVIPTYHPAFLLHGNYNYMGAWLYALRRAKQVSEKGWEPEPVSTIVDPSPDDFRDWARPFLEGGGDAWLTVDVETAEKLSGKSEGELESDSYNIVRINFAYHPDEGITVPFQEPWMATIQDLLAHNSVHGWWNLEYDLPRLRAAGLRIGGKQLDFMDAWHQLQSDLPRGLGFVAPFYSSMGAWKHLSGPDPGRYAAMDAAQTLRCAHGIARDLQQGGLWEAFWRDMYTLDTRALKPAEKAGVAIDIPQLQQFAEDLLKAEQALLRSIQELIPEEARPLVSGTPENPSTQGWLRRPKDREGVIEREVVDKQSGAKITKYYVRGEFNPDSPKQVLAYLAFMKLSPGRGKKGGGESADKLALEGLAKKNPVCALILKRRKITKVKSTYVDPTLAKVRAEGSDGRLHTTFTRTPSTQRLSSVAPNLQNVVARLRRIDGPVR